MGMRARLTLLVTAVFAIVTTVGAVAVVRIVEDRLVDDTRARLALNVSNDLALEALAFRLERMVRTAVR